MWTRKELKKKVSEVKEKEYKYKPVERKDKYLLVDGYNIIFAWPELSELAKINIDSARDALIDICCNYQGSKGYTLILVYDADFGKAQQYPLFGYGNFGFWYFNDWYGTDGNGLGLTY